MELEKGRQNGFNTSLYLKLQEAQLLPVPDLPCPSSVSPPLLPLPAPPPLLLLPHMQTGSSIYSNDFKHRSMSDTQFRILRVQKYRTPPLSFFCLFFHISLAPSSRFERTLTTSDLACSNKATSNRLLVGLSKRKRVPSCAPHNSLRLSHCRSSGIPW